MSIERIPLSPHLGLELKGVDLSRPLDAQVEREILDAWIDAHGPGKTNSARNPKRRR